MSKRLKARCVMGPVIIFFMVAFVMVGFAGAKSKVPDVVKIKVGAVMTLSGPGAFWHGPGGKAEIVFLRQVDKIGCKGIDVDVRVDFGEGGVVGCGRALEE